MRYVVLSDIHGNLEALDAVLADARQEADAVLCLGDVVGYGAEPAVCIERMAARARILVAGNHEHGVVGLLDPRWFTTHARVAVEWTRDRLDAAQRRYLAALPLTAEAGEALLVHASPDGPDRWDYLLSARDGFDAFPAFGGRLCFIGHTHRPAVWSLGASGPEFQTGGLESELALQRGRRYIVNVGSVGQPRDHDPRAAYALWDAERGTIAIRRVVYDVAAARKKILAGGLPQFLADRLARGA